jgi:KDO2-lipid IV(A) lauroyltransferase
MLTRVRQLHDEHRGCVFVTPHLGSWELLPYDAAVFGIPLTVPVRPLDNPYLERQLARARAATGHRFVSRRHGLLGLGTDLARGRSLAILADQATVGGPRIEFFGRPAHTSPVPALLAVRYGRPIVVVACVRTEDAGFTGWVSEPLWPDQAADESEAAQVERLTAAMNRQMEAVIRLYPDQYLWMHNRWKTYAESRCHVFQS